METARIFRRIQTNLLDFAGPCSKKQKMVADYKKTTLLSAKKDAVSEAKSKIKEKAEKKSKRETVLAALLAAGIGEEEITETGE